MEVEPYLDTLRHDIVFEGFQWDEACRDLILKLRYPKGDTPDSESRVDLVCGKARELEFNMTWDASPVPAKSWDIDYVGSQKHGWFVKMDFRPHGTVRFYCKTLELTKSE